MMTLSRTNKGFSLVEITIALGIAAFCLLAIFALLPTGMNTNRSSVQETIGASIASAIVADLRSTPTTGTGATSSPIYKLNPGTATNAGAGQTIYVFANGSLASSATDTSQADDIYKVVYTVTDDPTVSSTKVVDLKVQAPAPAPNPQTVFEAWTALDRK